MRHKKYFYYKGVRVNAFGLPVLTDEQKRDRKKYINRKRNFYGISFVSPFKKDASKNLIVMYDVADGKKKERDWLRRHLIKFGYIMIQRSVWVGPSPLPEQFVAYIKELGLRASVKKFKLAKPYSKKLGEL